jgi:carboxypeptidase Taq
MDNTKNFKTLDQLLCEIQDIKNASAVLSWDQNTYMPRDGASMRGRQLATLGKIAHEKFSSKEVGNLLDSLQNYGESLDYHTYESSLLRCARREYDKATKLPSDFVSKMYEHQSVCYDVWTKARAENNFKLVQPYLEKTLDFSRKYCSYFKHDHIADPLINESDEGFTTETVKDVFSKLREKLVPLVKGVLEKKSADDSCLKQHYPLALQEQLNKQLAESIGYDFNRGRLDTTHHPFMITFAHDDVRITTRYKENDLSESLFSTIHETGHALYELGCAKELDGTFLFGGTSTGVHESQSRLWENLVGRSHAFWEYFFPQLQTMFPDQLNKVTVDQFYQAINKVSKSLIRTDADELTYNLHVMIRFDLEVAMLEEKLKVADLPEAWNARYESDLSMHSETDSNGCMQDVHWYCALIGGQFQGYTLGNIMSAQFYNAAKSEHHDLENQIRKGNFVSLRNWLEKNLHCHGKKYTGDEVLKIATGQDLMIEPYVDYLTKKFS